MKETIISWTAPNFLTIASMMVLSTAIIGAIIKFMVSKRTNSED